MKKNTKKRSSHRLSLFLICLLLIASLVISWLFWRNVYVDSPRFNSVLFLINNEPKSILSGETLSLHPQDRIKILNVSTSIFFNIDIRLEAKDFDAGSLKYEEMRLSDLLNEQDLFSLQSFRIWIKHRNKNLGFMDLKVQLYAEDWLDKSNRTIDSAKRLSILEQGYHLIPDDRGLRQRLIDEYISQKLWKKAASMLEVLAEKDSDLEIIGELLSIYRAMSDKDGMISALKRIIALAPDDSDARSQLAEILEETGNITMAIEENQALLKRVSKTEKLPIYKTLGYLYSKTGKDKNAISSYLEAVKLDETDANLYFNLSYLYEKIHQDEKAYYFLEKAIKLKPGDEEGLLKLARWLSSKGDFSDSLKYLNDILLKNPKNIEAHYLTAQIMEKQGKKQELKKVYKDILNLDPDNETVIYNLGSLEYESGNLKEGLKYFRIYSKLHPKDISIHEIIFDIYQKLKDEEMAFKQAQILVDLNSKRLALYQFIFNYLNARAGFDMIIDIMEKGSKSNPDQIELMEYLVFAYLKTGDDERAIKQMEKIVQIKPADINRWMQIAKLKEKNNEFSDALKAYKKVLDLSPNHEDAQEGYLRLRLKGIQHE